MCDMPGRENQDCSPTRLHSTRAEMSTTGVQVVPRIIIRGSYLVLWAGVRVATMELIILLPAKWVYQQSCAVHCFHNRGLLLTAIQRRHLLRHLRPYIVNFTLKPVLSRETRIKLP